MEMNSKEDICTAAFISVVQHLPALWRRNDPDFYNQDARRRLFDTVAMATGMTGEACKKKLKVLKDKMRDVCQKLPKTKTGHPDFDVGENMRIWRHYKAMLFMKDQFEGREASVAIEVDEEPRENCIDNSFKENKHLVGAPSCGTNGNDHDAKNNKRTFPSSLNLPAAYPEGVPRKRGRKRADHISPVGFDPARSVDQSAEALSTSTTSVVREMLQLPSRTSHSAITAAAASTTCSTNFTTAAPASTTQCTNSSYIGNKHGVVMRDDWDDFMADMANDLRQITDPFLKLETKSKIRRVVEHGMHNQLSKRCYVVDLGDNETSPLSSSYTSWTKDSTPPAACVQQELEEEGAVYIIPDECKLEQE